MIKRIIVYLPLILILAAASGRYAISKSKGLDCRPAPKDYYNEETGPGNFLDSIRTGITGHIEQVLPSPHSDLLLGMVIGIDNFDKLPKFKEALRDTGTIHVVVVSGFNVSLVFSMVIKLLGSPYKKKNLLIGLAATFLYSVLSGFEAPVVRAWIMGSLAAIGKFYGRSMDIFQLIVFTASGLVLIAPCYLESLSFQLSFLATAGLVLFSESIMSGALGFCRFVGFKIDPKSTFLEDFSATVSAQIIVWPLISFRFGTVSVLGVVVNTLTLWVVPLITVMGFGVIILSFINLTAGTLLAAAVFPLLDIFVQTVNIFSKISFVKLEHEISLWVLIFYYSVLLVYVLLRRIIRNSTTSKTDPIPEEVKDA